MLKYAATFEYEKESLLGDFSFPPVRPLLFRSGACIAFFLWTASHRMKHLRNHAVSQGIMITFTPFETMARSRHVCPSCERRFTPQEEDEFIKKVRDPLLTFGCHFFYFDVVKSINLSTV